LLREAGETIPFFLSPTQGSALDRSIVDRDAHPLNIIKSKINDSVQKSLFENLVLIIGRKLAMPVSGRARADGTIRERKNISTLP
jgi:hypothetical protein